MSEQQAQAEHVAGMLSCTAGIALTSANGNTYLNEACRKILDEAAGMIRAQAAEIARLQRWVADAEPLRNALAAHGIALSQARADLIHERAKIARVEALQEAYRLDRNFAVSDAIRAALAEEARDG